MVNLCAYIVICYVDVVPTVSFDHHALLFNGIGLATAALKRYRYPERIEPWWLDNDDYCAFIREA